MQLCSKALAQETQKLRVILNQISIMAAEKQSLLKEIEERKIQTANIKLKQEKQLQEKKKELQKLLDVNNTLRKRVAALECQVEEMIKMLKEKQQEEMKQQQNQEQNQQQNLEPLEMETQEESQPGAEQPQRQRSIFIRVIRGITSTFLRMYRAGTLRYWVEL